LLLIYLALAYLLLPTWWRGYYHGSRWSEVPHVTRTSNGLPGDPVNVALVGTRGEVVRTLLAAGWRPADRTTWRTSVRIAADVLLGRSYPDAPVSNLYLWGRRQDLAFERAAGKSPRRRHHVRLWESAGFEDGRPVWLGAATFDRSVGVSRYTGQVTHHIEPDVDAERDLLLADLQRAGQLVRRYQVPGVGKPWQGRNGGGDRYWTDGTIAVGVLPP
jgi:hypothetical protein